MTAAWTLEPSAHGDGHWFVCVGANDVRVIAPPAVLVQRSERRIGPVGWRLAEWDRQARIGRQQPTRIREIPIQAVMELLPAKHHADVRSLLRGRLTAVRASVAATGAQRDAELTGSEGWLKEQLDAVTPRSGAAQETNGARLTATRPARRRSHPTPRNFARIGLAATASLAQGPTSPLAALVRELTPYLREYIPDIYALEGTYRTLVSCGLLRSYPAERLHCLAPRRIGGMIDIGAGLVGKDVTGLEAAFGPKHANAARQLDLDYELDCLIYLIDPMQATSALPATLTIKRECAIAKKPMFDNLAGAVEWFGLLGRLASDSDLNGHLLDDELGTALGYHHFPHRSISLISVDAKKSAMLDFVSRHLPFILGFETCSATASTAALLNDEPSAEGAVAATLDAEQGAELRMARTKLRRAVRRAGLEGPWVKQLKSGTDGGYVQIADALSMGLTDAAVFFRDPRAPDLQDGAEVLDRAPLMTNYPDRLSGSSGHVLIRDPRTAERWAQLWMSLPEGTSPTTVTAAFRDQLGVQLVLAEPREERQAQWDAITEEAAWYLVSAIAAKPDASARGGTCRRVTVACGSAMRKVIADIRDPVAFDLADRINAHHDRQRAAVEACTAQFPHRARLIDHIAGRKRLTLEARNTSAAALWVTGSVRVAPMVGMLGSTRRTNEANHNARLLAELVDGESLALAATAYVSGPWDIPEQIAKHWALTDFVLMACADLDDRWFGPDGRVALPEGMCEELASKGAVGEIAGLYLDAEGREVTPDNYRRQGMSLGDMQCVARAGFGGAAIMIAGANDPADDPPARVSTVLAAIRAGIVSVLITDLAFARSLLVAHATALNGNQTHVG